MPELLIQPKYQTSCSLHFLEVRCIFEVYLLCFYLDHSPLFKLEALPPFVMQMIKMIKIAPEKKCWASRLWHKKCAEQTAPGERDKRRARAAFLSFFYSLSIFIFFLSDIKWCVIVADLCKSVRLLCIMRQLLNWCFTNYIWRYLETAMQRTRKDEYLFFFLISLYLTLSELDGVTVGPWCLVPTDTCQFRKDEYPHSLLRIGRFATIHSHLPIHFNMLLERTHTACKPHTERPPQSQESN